MAKGKIESVKERLQGLIDLSNEVTEGEHTDLTSAVTDLAEKAKKGGSANTSENDAGGLTYDIKVGEITGEGDETLKANKFVLNGEAKIDLTNDTVLEEDVRKGKTFHKADGSQAIGANEGGAEGFVKVQFYNDDGTTLLYTVYVPSGSSAIYAGETPVSTEDPVMVFAGFEPAAVNVTEDMNCYAVYEFVIGTLDETSWGVISRLSADGTAQNYFAVGDVKMIHIEGNVGTLVVNGDYGVYIIGFDHNSDIEGTGIHFGTFKTAVSGGKDIGLANQQNGNTTDGTKIFNINHWGSGNSRGWMRCDMRYDILGSTDVPPIGYGAQVSPTDRGNTDATETCATDPVPDTLMDALPEDLRAVMKPMTKYTNNWGDGENDATKSIDYLPLLAEYEVLGKTMKAGTKEAQYQKRYAYFSSGKSACKYYHYDTANAHYWWLRSCYTDGANWVLINTTNPTGAASTNYSASIRSYMIAPIFKV